MEKNLKVELESWKSYFRNYDTLKLEEQKIITDYLVELSFKDNKKLSRYMKKSNVKEEKVLRILYKDDVLLSWMIQKIAIDKVLSERA